MSDALHQMNGTDQESGGFADYMARERTRLGAEREDIFSQQEELQRRLDEINREFAAVDAYESAKVGKAMRPKANAGKPRGQSGRRNGMRDQLLDLINQNNGLSRGKILDLLELKGDKSGEMSVSNALTALSKSGRIERVDRLYYGVSEAAHSATTSDHDRHFHAGAED